MFEFAKYDKYIAVYKDDFLLLVTTDNIRLQFDAAARRD